MGGRAARWHVSRSRSVLCRNSSRLCGCCSVAVLARAKAQNCRKPYRKRNSRMPAAGRTQHWFYASPSLGRLPRTAGQVPRRATRRRPEQTRQTRPRRRLIGARWALPPRGGRERGWTGEGYDACATGGASGSQWDPVTVSQSVTKKNRPRLGLHPATRRGRSAWKLRKHGKHEAPPQPIERPKPR